MAELVIGAFTAASSAVSGLLGIGGTAAAATGASAGGLGALSGSFSAFSGLASFGSGILGIYKGFADAQGQRMQAEQERLAGEETAADLMEQRNRTIANNLTIAAASGIDASVGDPVDAARQVTEDANRQIGTARSNASMKAYIRQMNARQSEIGGIASGIASFGTGAKELASSRISDARRGVPAMAA
jgi:DNA-binding protein H-NS